MDYQLLPMHSLISECLEDALGPSSVILTESVMLGIICRACDSMAEESAKSASTRRGELNRKVTTVTLWTDAFATKLLLSIFSFV